MNQTTSWDNWLSHWLFFHIRDRLSGKRVSRRLDLAETHRAISCAARCVKTWVQPPCHALLSWGPIRMQAIISRYISLESRVTISVPTSPLGCLSAGLRNLDLIPYGGCRRSLFSSFIKSSLSLGIVNNSFILRCHWF